MPGPTARINLEADSRGIRKGTDDLKKMERQAGRTEKRTKEFGRSVARAGKIAAVAGAALAGMFARAVLKATIEQEQAVAQLNASLVSTGKFTEEASQELQDYAAALQQASTFGDEQIIVMQSQLLTFKQLGDEVLPRTTQAVLDLSIKMGQDLRSSAVQLGKALNDPVANLGALGRVGIQFSKEQQALIKSLAQTNRLAEAQAIILDELESEFGGSAKAARDTLGGAIAVLSNNFGDLLEQTSGTGGVTAAINSLADTINQPAVKEGFAKLATGVLKFVEAMARIPQSIDFVKRSIKGLFDIVDEDSSLFELREKLDRLREGGGFWDAIFADTSAAEGEINKILGLIADIEFPEIEVTATRQDPDLPAANAAAKANAQKELNELLAEFNEVTVTGIKLADQVNAVHKADAEVNKTVLAGLELELELQGLSNIERAKRIALLEADATATSILGTKISDTIDQIAANDDQIRAMDSFRAASEDLFVDIADGSKSASEAFGDFMDTMRTRILRMIAEKLIEKLFGAFGSTGTGSAGGGIASFFASLFGPGRAHGGPLTPGKLHPITEQGIPELLNFRGQQFVVAPQAGASVMPISQSTSNTSNTTNVFNLPPTTRRNTVPQLANEVQRVQDRARARNR